MTNERFAALVQRLEREAAVHPAAYRLRVRLLAYLGYFYIGTVLAAVGAGLLFLGYLFTLHLTGASWVIAKVGWVLLLFAVIIVRALFVRFPPPDGTALERRQAPALFVLVDNIAQRLRARRPDRIFITDDFNASLAQRPRLGLLGWYSNDLSIGLPLMAACTREELAAVLAHELGHLSGQHGRFASRIYGARVRWVQLLEHLAEHGHAGSVVFRGFLAWYAPFFNAYTFVLARAQEYEADRASAKLVGGGPTRAALVRIALVSQYLSEVHWATLGRETATRATPPPDAVTRLVGSARTPTTDRWGGWLADALRVPTDYGDTHPSLTDRLAVIGGPAGTIEPPPPVAPGKDAARVLLGTTATTVLRGLDETWRTRAEAVWRAQHEVRAKELAELTGLDARAEDRPLEKDDAWRRAALTMQLRGDDDAIPVLRAVVEKYPEHAGAQFSLGRILAAHGEAAAREHLEVAAGDSEVSLAAAALLHDLHVRAGNQAEAERWQRHAVAHGKKEELAAAERAGVSATDDLMPHGLEATELTKLRGQLAGERVEAAFLVRKIVRHFPERPCYVLGVAPALRWLDSNADVKTQALMVWLSNEISYPGETIIVLLHLNAKLRKRLESISGSSLFND